MRKFTAVIAAVLLAAGMIGTAMAAPAVTDGTVTAWIGENGRLMLQDANGLIRQSSAEVADLVGCSDIEIYCMAPDGHFFAMQKSGLSDLPRDVVLTEEEAAALRKGAAELQDGILKTGETVISSHAVVYTDNGQFIYWIDQTDEKGYSVKQAPIPGKVASDSATGGIALSFYGMSVPEPLSLTVTKDALTVTTVDHKALVIDLATGKTEEYPAVSELTKAAFKADGKLYFYREGATKPWELEQVLILTPASTSTPAPTAKPTPTATVKPTAKPTATPRSSSQDSDIPDGAIGKGATGSTVRKIQQRLSDLGYPVGKVDGSYGDNTQLAINLFCDAIGVREHNYITKKVRNRLFADDAPVYDPYLPLKLGDRGVSVRYMQARLAQLGYDPGKQDGVYGKKTAEAVAKFQVFWNIQLEKDEKPGEKASRDLLMLLYDPNPGTPTPVPTETPTVAPTETPTPTPAPTSTPVPATPTDLK